MDLLLASCVSFLEPCTNVFFYVCSPCLWSNPEASSHTQLRVENVEVVVVIFFGLCLSLWWDDFGWPRYERTSILSARQTRFENEFDVIHHYICEEYCHISFESIMAFFVLNLKRSDYIQVTVPSAVNPVEKPTSVCFQVDSPSPKWALHWSSFWNGLEMSNKWGGYELGLTLRTLISTDSFGPDPTRHVRLSTYITACSTGEIHRQ